MRHTCEPQRSSRFSCNHLPKRQRKQVKFILIIYFPPSAQHIFISTGNQYKVTHWMLIPQPFHCTESAAPAGSSILTQSQRAFLGTPRGADGLNTVLEHRSTAPWPIPQHPAVFLFLATKHHFLESSPMLKDLKHPQSQRPLPS